MNGDRIAYIILSIVLWFVTVLILLMSVILPVLLGFVVIILVGQYFIIKKIKKLKKTANDIKKQEELLLKNGYVKLYSNIFIKENENKLNINYKDYGFSDILDCELVEGDTTLTSTFGKSNNNLSTLSTNIQYCTNLYINITLKDLINPNLKINLINDGRIAKSSNRYKELLNYANRILGTIKVIISKNNEKYTENGTITKIEHKCITEENATSQIEKLAQLYKEGILNDYEFETKKKELLDKVK